MSYEKCKYISLDKKRNKVVVNIASNNVRPLYWCKCEIYNDCDYSFEDKMLLLFVDMQQGNIQISTINKNTLDFEYALWKVREYHRENNISSFDDLYEGCGRLFESNKELTRIEVYRQVYGKSFEVFMKALNEKFEGDYMVRNKDAYYTNFIGKIGKYDRGYTGFWYGYKPMKFSYKQAYIFVKDMGEKYKLQIEKWSDSEVA